MLIWKKCIGGRMCGLYRLYYAKQKWLRYGYREAGLRLSGGEKQRISIARALLKNAPIVLSDEVTANVDSENEAKIHAALQELLKDKTVISIARNLAALRHARQIPVIENGSIVRRGTHDSLIREDGRYKELRELSEN